MKLLIGTMIGVAAMGASVQLTQAGEATGTINPSLLINNVLRQPVDHQQRQIAFDESLRQPGIAPANRTALGGEVQPDGSVKYGDVTVTSSIKNPCPPGEHFEAPAPPLARRSSRK